MSQYTMTVEEAVTRLRIAGVGRDKRTIERYCQFNHIDAIRIKTSGGDANDKGTYLLDPESVDGKIKKLLQKTAIEKLRNESKIRADDEIRQGQSPHDMSRPVAAAPDMSRQGTVSQSSAPSSRDSASALPQDDDLKKENEKLRDENLNLKIDNRAKEQVITLLSKERTGFMDTIRDMSFQIGGLTAKLGLSAPPPEGAVDNSGIESQPPV